jgi:hypothetical protein
VPTHCFCEPFRHQLLLANTPVEHPDYPLLETALVSVSKVAAKVSDLTRDLLLAKKMKEVMSKIVDWKQLAVPSLLEGATKYRRLVREGLVTRHVVGGGRPKRE